MPRASRRKTQTSTDRGDALDAAVEGIAPRTMIAAAQRITTGMDVRKISQSVDGWARESWRFYDTIGEFRYAVDWVAQMIAKATIHITRDGVPITEDDPAAQQAKWLTDLFHAPEVAADLLRTFGQHLTVAGDAYLIGTTVGGRDRWQVAAACELTVRAGKYKIAGVDVESSSTPFVLRIHRPHPRKPHEANAPSRAVLPILAEIDALTKRIFAEIDSRLSGAGILFVASEFELPAPLQVGPDGQQRGGSSADQFQGMLTQAITESIGDQTSAAARAPIVVTIPGDRIDQVKHLTFATPMDERVKELRDEAIRRLALGMDLPPEIMTGMADTNHWTAWSVDESAIKVHAEPLLDLITESLTTGLLWPLLTQSGIDPLPYAVGSDTAEMRLRPDRSREAFELYDRGVIDAVALRREVGFDETDAPSDDETREFFLRKVASGSTTPELVAAALQELGIDLEPAAAREGEDARLVEARPTPSLEAHPTTGPPDVPDGLVSAADVIVHRALERAGNRLRSKTGSKLTCPAGELYLHLPVSASMADDVLTDAFGSLHRYAACKSVEQDVLEPALDAYCRALLTTGRAHDPELMQPYLGRALTLAGAR